MICENCNGRDGFDHGNITLCETCFDEYEQCVTCKDWYKSEDMYAVYNGKECGFGWVGLEGSICANCHGGC